MCIIVISRAFQRRILPLFNGHVACSRSLHPYLLKLIFHPYRNCACKTMLRGARQQALLVNPPRLGTPSQPTPVFLVHNRHSRILPNPRFLGHPLQTKRLPAHLVLSGKLPPISRQQHLRRRGYLGLQHLVKRSNNRNSRQLDLGPSASLRNSKRNSSSRLEVSLVLAEPSEQLLNPLLVRSAAVCIHASPYVLTHTHWLF